MRLITAGGDDAARHAEQPAEAAVVGKQLEDVLLRHSAIAKDKVRARAIESQCYVMAPAQWGAHGHGRIGEFSEAVQNFPEVMECHILLGNVDFLLRIVAKDIESYEHFLLEKLAKLPMVESVNSMIAASQIKFSTALPLDLVRE